MSHALFTAPEVKLPQFATINGRGGLCAAAHPLGASSGLVWLGRAGDEPHNGNVSITFDTLAEAEAFAKAVNEIWPPEPDAFLTLGDVAAVTVSDMLANTPEAVRLVPRNAARGGGSEAA
jgi:hypothetical protein